MGAIPESSDLRWDAGGHGTPVIVFAHGWGHDRTVWGDLAATLADRFTTVSSNARGFGDSEDRLPDPDSWTLDTAVEDLAVLAASFAPAPVVAVGHSFQGSAVLALATRHVRSLAAVVAIGGAPRWTNGEGYGLAADPSQAAQMTELLRADYVGALEQLAAVYFPESDRDAAAKALAHTVAIARRVRRPDAAVRILERIYRLLDIRELLPRVQVPVLLIHGGRDAVAPPAVGEYLAARIPASQLEVISGAGHCPHMTCPEPVAAVTEHFLGRLGLGARPGAPHPSKLSN